MPGMFMAIHLQRRWSLLLLRLPGMMGGSRFAPVGFELSKYGPTHINVMGLA